MTFFTKREQIVILVLVIIIISFIGYNAVIKEKITISTNNSNSEIEVEIEANCDETKKNLSDDEANDKQEIIKVDISGQVHNPGVAVVSKGARLEDALIQVGGLIEETADRDRINLSRKLCDEEKIYIPAIGEDLPKDQNQNDNKGYYSGKININTASKDILMQLPGIGEVIAQRIIEYRKVNEFKNTEELTKVSGIGSKKYESIRDLVIVK